MDFLQGLGKGLGKVAGAAMDEVRKKAANLQKEVDRMERYDDDKLLRKLRTASGDQYLAILKVLKDRGYTPGELGSYRRGEY